MVIRLLSSPCFALLFFFSFTTTEKQEANNIFQNKSFLTLSIPGKDTLHVIIKQVDYDHHTWEYWGFTNDWFQEEIVTDLNTFYLKKNIRCFIDEDSKSKNITPDRIIEISLIDIEFKDRKTRQYFSKLTERVITGYTNTAPIQPIYDYVSATVFHVSTSVPVNAKLQYRIYIPNTDSTVMQGQFPIEYTWSHDSQTITGDDRAINNSNSPYYPNVQPINTVSNVPPHRNELLRQMVKEYYATLIEKLKKKIK